MSTDDEHESATAPGASAGQAMRLRGYCPLCISRCGAISTVENGRLTKVEPDPAHPTGESFCIKGRAAPALVHSDRRLLHPLMRTRPKGDPDPEWRRATWDEALDFTAGRMRDIADRHGPEAVAFGVTTPSGTAIADAFAWIHRLANAFGSPNMIFAAENCNWHKDFATELTFGEPIGTPDFERTGCMLLWGFNPSVTWPAYAKAARDAQRRGARLIVVDPRRAGLAASADLWLPVRPGTDCVLALAIAGVMIREGCYDRDFIARWTNGPFLVRGDTGRFLSSSDAAGSGFIAWDRRRARRIEVTAQPSGTADDALADAELFASVTTEDADGRTIACRPAFAIHAEICARHTPERAAEITGVPAEQIVAAARMLHAARPVSYFHWAGVCQQERATQTGRAIGLLYALTGSCDAPGGNVRFGVPSLADVRGRDLLPPEQREKTLGLRERPLGPPARGWITSADFARAALRGEPYPVRGLVSFGANPVLSKPHMPDLDPAMQGLDLHVHADMFLTPSARDADVVLPVASPWEREGLAAGFQLGQRGSSLLQLRRAVLEPLGECLSDTAIVFRLAERLGLGPVFFDGDEDAGLAHLLAPTGVSADELRAHPEGVQLDIETRSRRYRDAGFATPSARLEIYSEYLLAIGAAPTPIAETPAHPSPADFPLRLASAKDAHFCHSQHRALPSLRKGMPEPLAEMHPETARRHEIGNGDWIRIRTPVGAMRARAKVTHGIARDVVCAQYGWWEDCDALGLPGFALDDANFNALVDQTRIDPMSGSNALSGGYCAIARLDRQPAGADRPA